MPEIEEPLSMTPHDDVGAACAAINCVTEFDTALLDEEEKEIVKQIRLMSLYIIHIGIQEIYTSNFYGEEGT